MRSNRAWIVFPNHCTTGGSTAIGASAASVSCGLMWIITASATTKLTTVLAVYMTAGPTACRTASVSLVARLIRSPVRLAL